MQHRRRQPAAPECQPNRKIEVTTESRKTHCRQRGRQRRRKYHNDNVKKKKKKYLVFTAAFV